MAKLERSRCDAVDQWRLQTGRHEVWMLALDPLCCCFYSAPKCLGCWRKTLSPPSGNLQSSWKIQVQDPVRSQDPLEKEMATHSSILAWRIPWTKEPGGLQSTGSQRVGHDWETSLSLAFTFKEELADDTTLMAESEEELKSLLMKVKEESEKLA